MNFFWFFWWKTCAVAAARTAFLQFIGLNLGVAPKHFSIIFWFASSNSKIRRCGCSESCFFETTKFQNSNNSKNVGPKHVWTVLNRFATPEFPWCSFCKSWGTSSAFWLFCKFASYPRCAGARVPSSFVYLWSSDKIDLKVITIILCVGKLSFTTCCFGHIL